MAYSLGYQTSLTPWQSIRIELIRTFYNSTKTKPPTFSHELTEDQFTVGYTTHLQRFNSAPHQHSLLPAQLGLYAGAAVGSSALRADFHQISATTDAKNHHLINGNNGSHASASIGYSTLYGTTSTGALNFKLKYQQWTTRKKSTAPKHRDFLNSKSFNVVVTPGYLLKNNSLILGQLGVAMTTFEKPSPALRQATANKREDQGPNFNTNTNGIIAGIGYQTAIFDHIALRGMYSHRFYEAIRTTENDAQAKPFLFHDWHLQTSHLNIGINYTF